MKKGLVFLNIFFLNFLYSQDCSQFQEGVFNIDIGFGNFSMERKRNFQLEKSKDFGTVYLQKIEPISECEYILKRYKILFFGDLPMPKMSEIIKIKIYKIEGNNFFFHSEMLGTKQSLDGKFVKVSDEISQEFKEILEKEK